MIKSIEATGKTIDDAVENAIALLGVDRYEVDVSIEIIDRPKSGFLGLGSTPAKIRASYDDGVAEPKPQPAREPKPVREPKPTREAQPAREPKPVREAQPSRPAQTPREPRVEAKPLEAMTENGIQRAEKATAFLNGLLSRMGANAQPAVGELDDGTIDIHLEGENLGALIGRRGETLNAIQHITNFVVNKGSDNPTRIIVDVEDYRKKREESLQKLAIRTAAKVVKMRRNFTLEPMNAYERHVIHTALQEWRDVSTFSTGSEPRRAVVVSFTPGGGSGKKSGDSERRQGDRPPRRDGGRGHGRPAGNRPPRDSKPAEPRPEPKPLEVKEFS